MKITDWKKSMTIENLSVYHDDLIKMGFVSKHIDDNGTQYYKLTKLGEKSGLKDFSN
jgi:predicted transcriptional regulator